MRNPARLVAMLIALNSMASPTGADDLSVAEALALGRDRSLSWGGFTLTPGLAETPVPGADAPAPSDVMLGHPAMGGFGVVIERGTDRAHFGGLAYVPAPGMRLGLRGHLDRGSDAVEVQLRLNLEF